mmetsp:Transcript_5722/g.6134  ORF Transcript_5722/g.6134 Transcript_5722/m.6134 type:complete len:474 (+) Transcript_5722:35-1456(+)
MVESHVKVKKNWFIRTKNDKIEDNYKFDIKKDKLGEGTYGNVIKGYTKEGNNPRAIKVIPKSKVKNPERFKLEIEIMRHLDHPNIMKLYETFEDPRHVYLVMDLCTGGELFDRIIDKGRLSEAEARNVFLQIMRALFYCHSNKICHRDLKPENLVFDQKDGENLKLIDFGMAAKFRVGDKLTKKLGTPYYIAPEVINRNYDEKCDVWSCGVIMYIMLCGYPPFHGDSDDEILKKIQSGKFQFEGPSYAKVWTKISPEAKEVITQMLTLDHTKRPSALEILQHPWIQKNVNKEPIDTEVLTNLSAFSAKSKLKQAILEFIAVYVTSENEKKKLEETFRSLDKDNNGTLSYDELVEGFTLITGSKEIAIQQAQTTLERADFDKSGVIDYSEFVVAAMSQEKLLSKTKIEEAFKRFDKNGDGYIERAELSAVLGGVEIDEEQWQKIINDCDTDKDGKISYEEFTLMLTKEGEDLIK